jgi:hypothetical protein
MTNFLLRRWLLFTPRTPPATPRRNESKQ